MFILVSRNERNPSRRSHQNQMISERYILLPCLEGCSKSGVFTVLHNKAPAS